MKIKTKNLGSYGLILSVALVIIGIFNNNLILLIVGLLTFIKLINTICYMARIGAEMSAQEAEAKAYSMKTQADTKSDLLSKSYKDSKMSDEAINKVSIPIAEKSLNTISNNSKELGITYSKKYELKGKLKNITKNRADLQLYNLIVNKDIVYFANVIVNVLGERYPRLWMNDEPLATLTLMCVLAHGSYFDKISYISTAFVNDKMSWGSYVEEVWDVTDKIGFSNEFYDDVIDYLTLNAKEIRECINDKFIDL